MIVFNRKILRLTAATLGLAFALSTSVSAQPRGQGGVQGDMRPGSGMMGQPGTMAQRGMGSMMEGCVEMGGSGKGMGMGMMHGNMGGGMMSGGMMGGMPGARDQKNGQGGMMQDMERHMDDLELSDEQRERMEDLPQADEEARAARMRQMMELRDSMHELMSSNRPDPEAVQELHGRMAEIHGEMLADQVRFCNGMRDILKEEQLQELERNVREDMRPEEPAGDHESHH